ncbi:hypothetical protein PTKIN_Ptkin08bG0126300 [Pterospermum kingtungense]
MSHINVQSHGYIPFSWEDKPGVSKSKVTHNDECTIDIGFYVLNQTLPLSDSGGSPAKINVIHDKKIPPPPPCSINLPPKRSTSVKGLRWGQEDPFLAAYKECTKRGGDGNKSLREGRKNGGAKFVRKMKIIFSCKDSSDVIDDNLLRLVNLPPLPKDRIRGRQVYPLNQVLYPLGTTHSGSHALVLVHPIRLCTKTESIRFGGHEEIVSEATRIINGYHDPIIDERVQQWRG